MSDQLHGRINPHMSSAMKLFTTELVQRFSETGVDLLGPYGTLWEGSRAGSRPWTLGIPVPLRSLDDHRRRHQ